MSATDKLDEDYQKIAHQVSQLRQAARPHESSVHGHPGQRQANPQENEKNECVFCKIVKREVPARFIEETSSFAAFLDIQPKAVGHVIIISKRHFAGMDEMNGAESSLLVDMINSITKRMKSNLKATGYGILSSNGISAGQVVPHFAIHIIPTYSHTVDIPILNVIQPQKVPEFVMADTERLLRRIDK